MNKRQKKEAARLAGEKITFDCPMAPYTTFHVGGKSEGLYRADNQEELRRIIVFVNREKIPYLVVGRGSNLLVKDKGIDGLVILLEGALAAVEPLRTISIVMYKQTSWRKRRPNLRLAFCRAIEDH